ATFLKRSKTDILEIWSFSAPVLPASICRLLRRLGMDTRAGAELTRISRMFWVCWGIRLVSSRIDVFAILRSAQPRRWANVAIDTIAKIAGKIARQYRSIFFARSFFWVLSRMMVATTSMREKKTSNVLARIKT